MSIYRYRTRAAVLVALLAFAPSFSQAESSTAKPAMTSRELRAAEHAEARLERLHDRLAITADQEPLWTKVAQTMRDNATKFRESFTERDAQRDKTSAIDDLKSFLIISDEHSAGLKRLIPPFSALYESLSPAQKKHADRIFERDDGRDHI